MLDLLNILLYLFYFILISPILSLEIALPFLLAKQINIIINYELRKSFYAFIYKS